jgi:DNA-directed RNA polymerase specialized sigma24 family protein
LDDEDDDWSFDDEPAQPDPIVADVFGGISRRALAEVRDNLASATTQYEHAVRQARANGWSWAEIGRILGVSRQVLHRRFRNHPSD